MADIPDTTASPTPNPAVLRFRGLDLEAMTALQMRNINALRRMANLMLDSTETITERQAAFLKASADKVNGALEDGGREPDPKAIFEWQSEAYRDLFGALADHVGEIAEISSKCCAGLVQQATGNMVDLPVRESRKGLAARRAGAVSKPKPAKS